jgi:hypothetical protein
MDFFRQFIRVLAAVFASRLAPTSFVNTLDYCGSEPAREEARNHTADFATEGLGRITLNP